MSGGFLFSDTLHESAKAVYKNIRALWSSSLASVGQIHGTHWDFEKIPESHGLYHCYFDFAGPPPAPAHGKSGSYAAHRIPPVEYLDGVFIGGRLLGICTSNNYWYPFSNGYANNRDNTRFLQFGVNIIILALTQEGSITNRVMDTVR